MMTGTVAEPCQQQHVARLDRHAEMKYLAAGGDDGGWYRVGAILGHGAAGNQQQVAAGRPCFEQGGGDGSAAMRAALHQAEMGAELVEPAPAAGHRRRVVARRLARQPGDDQRRTPRLERQQRHGCALPRRRTASIDHATAHGQRDDLHRGDHGAGPHRCQRRQSGDGNGLVDGIDAVDDCSIDADQAALRGVEVAAPGMRCARGDVGAGQGGGNRRGGGVLVEVAGLQPGAVHPRDARGVEGRKVGAGETAPLLENSVRQAQAVRQQQAFAFRQREFAEDHAPVSTRSPR
jgi:hypothetical protein